MNAFKLRNDIESTIENEDDSWMTDEKLPMPEFISPSNVRNHFESPKSVDPNDQVAKTIPAFIFERNHKNIKLDHLENINNKERDFL